MLWLLRRMGTFEVQGLLVSEYHYSPDSAQLDVNNCRLGKGKITLVLRRCHLSAWFPSIFFVYHNSTPFQTWICKQNIYKYNFCVCFCLFSCVHWIGIFLRNQLFYIKLKYWQRKNSIGFNLYAAVLPWESSLSTDTVFLCNTLG